MVAKFSHLVCAILLVGGASSSIPKKNQGNAETSIQTPSPRANEWWGAKKVKKKTRTRPVADGGTKIVNGEEATPHSMPWMVSLQGSAGGYCFLIAKFPKKNIS
jgi:hypothetical protein